MKDYSTARKMMVQRQLVGRGVRDHRVLAAMEEVPRHFFVDESLWNEAYDDSPLPIGEGQTISQPYMVAVMTELLHLDGEERGTWRSARVQDTRRQCSPGCAGGCTAWRDLKAFRKGRERPLRVAVMPISVSSWGTGLKAGRTMPLMTELSSLREPLKSRCTG